MTHLEWKKKHVDWAKKLEDIRYIDEDDDEGENRNTLIQTSPLIIDPNLNNITNESSRHVQFQTDQEIEIPLSYKDLSKAQISNSNMVKNMYEQQKKSYTYQIETKKIRHLFMCGLREPLSGIGNKHRCVIIIENIKTQTYYGFLYQNGNIYPDEILTKSNSIHWSLIYQLLNFFHQRNWQKMTDYDIELTYFGRVRSQCIIL